jgi:hypothetical protein
MEGEAAMTLKHPDVQINNDVEQFQHIATRNEDPAPMIILRSPVFHQNNYSNFELFLY